MPWTQVSAIDGIKPSEWIRKHVTNQLPPHKMPRKGWMDILGADYMAFRQTIQAWQDCEWYSHAWNTFSERKVKQDDRDWLAKVQAQLRAHGWFGPRLVDGTLTFGSLYRTDHIHDERQGFAERSQPIETEFPRE